MNDKYASEISEQVVNWRCRICPRTSYSTTGFTASTLLVAPLQPLDDSVVRQEIEVPLCSSIRASKEFETVATEADLSSVQRIARGHSVLLYNISNTAAISLDELQTINGLIVNQKSKLVFLLVKSSSPLSNTLRLAETMESATVSWTHVDYCFSGPFTLHVVHSKSGSSFSATTNVSGRKHPLSSSNPQDQWLSPDKGFNNQPSVQSGCQFRYLWSQLPVGSDCCPTPNSTETMFIEDAKKRTLNRIASHPLSDGSKLSVEDWDLLISEQLKNDKCDYDIYDMIREKCTGHTIMRSVFDKLHTGSRITSVNSAHGATDKSNAENGEDSAGRNSKLVKDIINCIPYEYKKSVTSVLDFGCAEGAITSRLGHQLHLSADKISGADVRLIPAEGFQFHHLASEAISTEQSPALGTILPMMKDSSIQMINTSMVFHHVTFIEATLLELHRVVDKHNGFLILREHDCNNRATAVFLDIVHGLYSLAWSMPVESPDFLETYRAFYRSRDEWTLLLSQYGFQSVFRRTKEQEYFYNVAYSSRFREDGVIYNVTRGYHAVYRPIGDPKKMAVTDMKGKPSSTLEIIKSNNRIEKHASPPATSSATPQPSSEPTLPPSEEETIMASDRYAGRLFKFNRRTGKSEWL